MFTNQQNIPAQQSMLASFAEQKPSPIDFQTMAAQTTAAQAIATQQFYVLELAQQIHAHAQPEQAPAVEQVHATVGHESPAVEDKPVPKTNRRRR